MVVYKAVCGFVNLQVFLLLVNLQVKVAKRGVDN